MVVDSSAILAILQGDAGHERLLEALLKAPVKGMSAFTLLELESAWFARTRSHMAVQLLRRLLLSELRIRIIPFDEAAAALAFQFFSQYGRGMGEPGLTAGDCVVAALAEQRNEPVLSAASELAHTGVKRAGL